MSSDLFRPSWKKEGFTLIELLIVIAIILILIAIALPNFLEAQVRARVTRAKGEIRTISIAMQSYYLDFNIYPSETESDIYSNRWNRFNRGHLWLTSPTKYLSTVPEDPFASLSHIDAQGPGGSRVLTYESGGIEPHPSFHPMGKKCRACMLTWAMWSKGPSGELDGNQIVSGDNAHKGNGGRDVRNYSPTNGTSSRGSILTWGGDPLWIAYPKDLADPRDVHSAKPDPIWVDGQFYIKKLPPQLR